MKHFTKLLGVVLFGTTLLSGTVQADDQLSYAYCSTSFGESTNLKWVVSSVFRVKAGTYHVGVRNSFSSYIKAEFGEPNSPICSVTFDSYQEAQDSRNDQIGDLRRRDWTVYTVHWAYRGD